MKDCHCDHNETCPVCKSFTKLASCPFCAEKDARIEAYFTAAGFENAPMLLTKPPKFFNQMGKVVAERTKELYRVLEVAAQRPNKFGPHYMIWMDRMDKAIEGAKK